MTPSAAVLTSNNSYVGVGTATQGAKLQGTVKTMK